MVLPSQATQPPPALASQAPCFPTQEPSMRGVDHTHAQLLYILFSQQLAYVNSFKKRDLLNSINEKCLPSNSVEKIINAFCRIFKNEIDLLTTDVNYSILQIHSHMCNFPGYYLSLSQTATLMNEAIHEKDIPLDDVEAVMKYALKKTIKILHEIERALATASSEDSNPFFDVECIHKNLKTTFSNENDVFSFSPSQTYIIISEVVHHNNKINLLDCSLFRPTLKHLILETKYLINFRYLVDDLVTDFIKCNSGSTVMETITKTLVKEILNKAHKKQLKFSEIEIKQLCDAIFDKSEDLPVFTFSDLLSKPPRVIESNLLDAFITIFYDRYENDLSIENTFFSTSIYYDCISSITKFEYSQPEIQNCIDLFIRYILTSPSLDENGILTPKIPKQSFNPMNNQKEVYRIEISDVFRNQILSSIAQSISSEKTISQIEFTAIISTYPNYKISRQDTAYNLSGTFGISPVSMLKVSPTVDSLLLFDRIINSNPANLDETIVHKIASIFSDYLSNKIIVADGGSVDSIFDSVRIPQTSISKYISRKLTYWPNLLYEFSTKTTTVTITSETGKQSNDCISLPGNERLHSSMFLNNYLSEFIISLIYLNRWENHDATDLNFNPLTLDNETKKITPYNFHRLFLTCNLIMSKVSNDHIFSNRYYAFVGGISLSAINKLEMQLLDDLNFKVNISELEYYDMLNKFTQWLQEKYFDVNNMTKTPS